MDKVKPEVMVRENLNAYYFSFNPTGNADIDRILGAIAYAGKAYHHTEDWESDDVLSVSCADNIQNAANLAAANLATPAPDSEKLREEAERYRQALEDVRNPLAYLQRMAEAEGSRLSGMAYAIANDPATLQRIATEALGASA